jgi:alcohol/geraniol dehydrogenase (NADP+)
MNYFNAYAATFAKGPLKPFSFDPGELGPEEVEIKVGKARYRIVLENDLA